MFDKKLKLSAVMLAITSLAGFSGSCTPAFADAPAGGILLPYIALNVDELDSFTWYKGQPNLNQNNPIAYLGNYFPAPPLYTPATSYVLSGDAQLSGYFNTIAGNSYIGQIFLNQPLTEAAFVQFSSDPNCSPINGDPNKLVCNLIVSTNGGRYGTQGILPIVLNNGLRAYSVEELIRSLPAFDQAAARPNRWDQDNGVINTQQPYLLEISAVPDDFNTPVSVVNLNDYFYNPDKQAPVFSFDSSQVAAGFPIVNNEGNNCNTVLITGINSEAHPNPPVCADTDFTINANGDLVAQNLQDGVYQINVKATAGSESAWQTFYINVNEKNPNLAAWQTTGAIATANVIGSFPAVYVYSGQDPDKQTGWPSDFVSYGKDIAEFNKDFLYKNPIQTVLAEIIEMQYNYTDPDTTMYKLSHWALTPLTGNDNDPADEITASGIKTNRDNLSLSTFIPQLVDKTQGAFGQYGVGLTLNFDFDNNVKADFLSFNSSQQNLLADALVYPVLYASTLNPPAKIDGLALDLEASFNQPNAAQTFKKLADRLAYHGKWLSYFAFPEMFDPNTIAAFGPLGVGSISTYDIANIRAPQDPNTVQAKTIAYQDATDTFNSSFTSIEANQIYNAFYTDANKGNCNTAPTVPLPLPFDLPTVSPKSWCNISLNDSISENYRRFTSGPFNQGAGVSPAQAMMSFHGNYALSLPVAGSATEWEAVEIWQPDFTEPATVMVNPVACSSINNSFLAENDSSLDVPGSAAYNALSACLQTNVNVGPATVQTFGRCGYEMGSTTEIPYNQCIMVSNVPGKGANDADVTHPAETDYIQNNLNVYLKEDPQNYVGYAVYALQNPAAAHPFTNGTVNSTIQEPWYVGYNYTPAPQNQLPYDPAYSQAANNAEWSALGSILSVTTGQ